MASTSPAERWRRVEELYHAALELPAGERSSWLAAASDDGALRAEVEALLRYDAAALGFLERPALQEAASALAAEPGWLVGRRLGDYEVLALAGAGSSGEVYRARDVRLRREVALKVLDASISPGTAALEAEARAASGLNHPNIVTIYGVGEDEHVAWIAMELVAGRSLRELLGEGALPAERALDVLVQLADAIAAAHSRGIVHRDLKPENVMVSLEGRVKVLDFGIALLDGHGPASDTGALVGTVDYMAPEQARGERPAAAADQFAIGVIAYEMLTGRRPFTRATRAETLAAIAGREPAPPLEPGARASPLAAIVSRCLSKAPDERYSDTGQLLAALRRAEVEIARQQTAAGLDRRRALQVGGLAALGAVGALAALSPLLRGRSPRSLAVLPFANPAGDETTGVLCDGVTETLIRQLARLPGLTVIARATSFAFKGGPADPRAAGLRLDVDSVLSGSLARRAGRIHVSAELVETATGARLWGAEFDRPALDVLAVQNEIARAILLEGLKLSPGERALRRVAQSPTDDPAAYELFLEGVHNLRLGTEEGYIGARVLLRRSVERAPRFALALATLASTYSVVAVDGYAAPADCWPESDRLVARALEADPESADAHAEAAASAFFYRWDWGEARRRWDRALRLRSEVQSELLCACALQRLALGETEAALELARAARQVDPLNAGAAVREADVLAGAGHLDAAAAVHERTVRDWPGEARALFGLADVRRRQGRFDAALDARRLAHAAAGDDTVEPLFARVRGAAGYEAVVRESARGELERLALREEAGGYVSPLDFARAHALLGDATRAFSRLAEALQERAAGLALLKVDPAWEPLRGDARFTAAVRWVGIP